MTELLKMCGISKSFPGVKALSDVSLTLYPGEVHALCGENGAGKSTLMKVLSGVYQADEGEIYINGEKVTIENTKKAQQLGISIIFQEFNLCSHLTVADNIWLDRQPKKGAFINDKKLMEKTQEILNELGLSINPKARIRTLSVAEQQMVEIAKAISFNSKILVLDEPTAALTESEIERLFSIIHKLKAKGVGMIYISHRLEELSRITDRVSVIRDGQYIGTENYADVTIDRLVQMMVGRELSAKFPVYQRTIGDVLFEGRNIVNNKVNVENIKVKAGEIVGIAGLMGAGRTELARAIFGADKTLSKEIFIEGKSVTVNSITAAIKNGIGYITEDRKKDGLALNMTVERNINLAHIPNLCKNGFVDAAEADKNALEYIDSLRIKTPSMRQKVTNLSGGNQQKIVLAKWLCNDIKVLIFDEPTRGIDVAAKYEVYELMNRLSDNGVAVIMISSDLPEILGMSDRILVMHGGKINGELSREEATQEKILRYAAGLQIEDRKGA
ncbi:monosaccharide ABC transporter ATP-binding protein (CUT2 family) [Hydrogenoanaerobacterium saccharovorans]|uniref:Monosaccharide ABC transporter ATP-binding protein, CUT2 family n=1 Tax=Hydrogenoanaerobacterium saccharovorans TaxID=474960 RepID=A0A1H7YQH0_9FIRM|nr:sugar ABC transporter ATP-binding protein [Hydrogenoanaerobacterium saccharovorans]RPF49119.1 monosaccharide ABC transporter ATP-binding protein (CUT2 family) [Hydrogenoanaerobacterium saccharovorans]SEM47439.1 monosaccharide ABC transporter ATP-binding protein, CUT2 family [Hydrogenoanaerobacterium saccharovorans]